MSWRYFQDGSKVNAPDVICAQCLKVLSFYEVPKEVKYWFVFCSAECLALWEKQRRDLS